MISFRATDKKKDKISSGCEFCQTGDDISIVRIGSPIFQSIVYFLLLYRFCVMRKNDTIIKNTRFSNRRFLK
jgi:hypothetical protein